MGLSWNAWEERRFMQWEILTSYGWLIPSSSERAAEESYGKTWMYIREGSPFQSVRATILLYFWGKGQDRSCLFHLVESQLSIYWQINHSPAGHWKTHTCVGENKSKCEWNIISNRVGQRTPAKVKYLFQDSQLLELWIKRHGVKDGVESRKAMHYVTNHK